MAEELGGATIAGVSNIAGAAIAGQLQSNAQANTLVSGAVNAIVAGNANSNATLASVTTSFTNALMQSTTGAQELAAGALNQEGQIAGGAIGAPVSSTPYDVVPTGGLSGTAEIVIALAAGVLLLWALSSK